MATLRSSAFPALSFNKPHRFLLLNATPRYTFLCCSLQNRNSPPISERHASSPLASSLLRQHMQTPQGESLMAFTNQGLPPTLISLAASHHLELLAATSSSVTFVEAHVEGVLHRRIVELKEREKREAIQEILLALVASKLLHATKALPDLHRDTTLASSEQHTCWQDATLALRPPRLDDMLQAIHAPDVQPLTSRHVAMVINGKNHAKDPVEPTAIALMQKFELGKMYAASVMHGYFLARVYQRFKLEQIFQVELLPKEASLHAFNEAKFTISMEAYMAGDGFQDEATIRRMSNVSGSLTLNVIERHCEAMFGPIPCHTKSLEVKTSKDTDTTINIQLGFVRTLIYQALAFGALLWDMEHNFVPLFYPHICQED